MAPKQPTNVNSLLEKVLERLDTHSESLTEGQSNLSNKVDDLSGAYTNLAARLLNVEGKDFDTAVTKIQESTHKLTFLDKLIEQNMEKIEDIQVKIEINKEKIDKIESKIDKIQLYINIVAFVIMSVVMPLFVTWLSKVVFATPAGP